MTDYIERERALAMLHKDEFGTPDERWHPESEIAEAILRVPAADVAPVVHGKWIWDKDGMDWGIGAWRCSICYARPETWWQGDKSNPRNKSGHYYRSNCAAKMEEEDEE